MTLDEVNAEIAKLREIPAGPNQALYIRGAIQALLWLRDGSIPPSNIYEVICSEAGRRR